MVDFYLLLADLSQATVQSANISGQDIFTYIGAVLALIAVNAFFVAAEFAIVSVRRSRIHQLVESGSSRALVVQRLQRRIDRFLSATQLGITLSSVGLGWLGKDAMAVVAMSWLNNLPLPLEMRRTLAESLAIPLAFLAIVYLQIVLGELLPKSFALLNSETTALWLGKPSEALADAFSPFLWVLNQSTRLLLRLGGVEYTSKSWYSAVSVEELQMIISTSTESVGLEAGERELLNNVFEFSQVTAADVMIPRTSIEYVEANGTIRDLLVALEASNHSCYPIAGESLDDIKGVVAIKEIIGKLGDGSLHLEQSIDTFVRPIRFVSEDTYLGNLLPQMQRSQHSMVIIVDEFGGTAGLVTLQDIMGKIFGNFDDTPPSSIPDIRIIDSRTSAVQAQVSVEEVNATLGLELPQTDEYQTLGGFVIYLLQKIPSHGEKMTYGNLEFTVTAIDGPRLDRILIHRLDLHDKPHTNTQTSAQSDPHASDNEKQSENSHPSETSSVF